MTAIRLLGIAAGVLLSCSDISAMRSRSEVRSEGDDSVPVHAGKAADAQRADAQRADASKGKRAEKKKVVADGPSESVVEFRNNHTIEVVIITLPGCPPCNRLKSQIPEIPAQAKGLIELADVHQIEYNSADAKRYAAKIKGLRLGSFPTIILVVDGEGITHFVGGMSASELVAWVRDQLTQKSLLA